MGDYVEKAEDHDVECGGDKAQWFRDGDFSGGCAAFADVGAVHGGFDEEWRHARYEVADEEEGEDREE